ncbi:MAG: LamG domain-containing protein, partial [Candidatus Thermoplasmatota archaeon]|nr:LamG domain-containing protein [Candidatus Thermoplasmatota archaeon]
MYMNVKGNILNGVSIPSFTAKSMPDLKTGSFSNSDPSDVTNQESTPLPVISSEDSIYVLIDTDNDYSTGYSTLGTGIGAEKMIEIRGVHGIITLRVMKEWTGTNVNDWEWSEGEIIDAAASGSEMELEVSSGDYWIHIISWNGEEESSSDFGITSDLGRYADMGSACVAYFKFNGNNNDSCTDESITLSLNGGADTSSAGKMGNGLTLDGVDGYAQGSDDGAFVMNADWSIEAWIKAENTGQGTIIAIADGDGTEEDDELSIHFNSANRLQVCGGGDSNCATTSETFSTGIWYHIAVTHDYTNQFSNNVDIYINNKRVVEDNGFTDFDGAVSNADLIIGKGDEDDSTEFFEGVIDEVRILNYQSMAFGGGLMITKVAGEFLGSGTITIMNTAGSTVDLTGIKLMKNSVGDVQCDSLSGTLAAGATTTASCSSLNPDGMVYLADMDG